MTDNSFIVIEYCNTDNKLYDGSEAFDNISAAVDKANESFEDGTFEPDSSAYIYQLVKKIVPTRQTITVAELKILSKEKQKASAVEI